ncbi:MAG: hypothetical protein ACRDHV_00805 [Actinomycetota bacterium]
MTDLRERFRGLDQVPVPDLLSEIRGRRPSRSPPGPPWRRLGATAVALVVAAGGLALAGRAFLGDQRDRPLRAGAYLPSPDERAATVAIAAVADAGLRDGIRMIPSEDAPGDEPAFRMLVPYDYVGISRDEGGWTAAFCASPPEDRGCDREVADSFLTVVPDGEDLVVADASGTFTEAHRDRLIGYTEPAEAPADLQIHLPVRPIRVPGETGLSVAGAFYWTGPIPSNLGAVCRTEVLDAQGQVVFTREFTSLAPEHERERDSMFVLEPPEEPTSEARIACGEWQPVEAVPSGPRHVLASGIIEEGQYAVEPWRLVVWRGENVDDPERLELWRQNAEGNDVYCWGFDVDPLTSVVHGQRVPPGGCSPLAGAATEAIGERATVPVAGEGSNLAVGVLSTVVASLELRLDDGMVIVADLLDPPPELGVPRRFFVEFLPQGARGEMVALDAGGSVMATEPLRGGGSA